MLTNEQIASAKLKYSPEQIRWIQELHTVASANAERYGMMINPNVDVVLATCRSLTLTDGYCPSVSFHERNYNTVCPCKDMREHQTCRCGLFVPKKKA